MSIEAPTAGGSNLVARVKGILFQPTAEWNVIDSERADIKGLFTGYAAILAAIGPVATAVGTTLLFPFGLVGNIVTGVISYVLALVGTYVLGLIIEALAPNFGGTKDRLQAMKVAVYSSTASWLGGVCGFLIFLAPIGAMVGGLYSLFLLYKGLPILMKAPQDKAITYTIVVIVAAIAVGIAIASVLAIVGSIFTAGALGAAAVANSAAF